MTEATPLLTGVDFITLPTKNYDHAAEFYGDVLGLPFSKRWGNFPAGELETGNLDDRRYAVGCLRHRVPTQQHSGRAARRRLRGGESRADIAWHRVQGRHARLRRLLPGFLRGSGWQHAGDPSPLRAAGRQASDLISNSAMAVDLVIDIENTPGSLAQVAAAISDAGVNIAAATCVGPGERAELHILVPHARPPSMPWPFPRWRSPASARSSSSMSRTDRACWRI